MYKSTVTRFQLWLSSSSLCILPFAHCVRSGSYALHPVAIAALGNAMSRYSPTSPPSQLRGRGSYSAVGLRPRLRVRPPTYGPSTTSAPPGPRADGGRAAAWPGPDYLDRSIVCSDYRYHLSLRGGRGGRQYLGSKVSGFL